MRSLVVVALDIIVRLQRSPGVNVTLVAVIVTALATLLADKVWLPVFRTQTLASVAGSFKTRFICRLAIADLGFLVGFVGYVITVQPWLYLVGFAAGAYNMLRTAPRDSYVDAEAAVLRSTGSEIDLGHAVTSVAASCLAR